MAIAAIVRWIGRRQAEVEEGAAQQLGERDRSEALERLEWFRAAACAPDHPSPRVTGRVRLGMWPH